MKRKDILAPASTGINFEGLTPSEISQTTKRQRLRDSTCVRHLKESDSQREWDGECQVLGRRDGERECKGAESLGRDRCGDGCPTVRRCLMPLNWTLRNG